MRELVGEQEIEIPDAVDMPTFLPSDQQVGTAILGRQVLEEMSDTPLIDETENEMENKNWSYNNKEDWTNLPYCQPLTVKASQQNFTFCWLLLLPC